MILYALTCDAAHEFEAWFRNSEDFDQLQVKGLLECPFCQTRKVRKAPMAPAIAKYPKFDTQAALRDHRSGTHAPSGPSGAISDSMPSHGGAHSPQTVPGKAAPTPGGIIPGVPGPDRHAPDLAAIAQQIQTHIAQSFDDVGRDFAKEARRRHAMAKEDPEISPRPIYGEASPSEARSLRDEGIGAYDLPDAFAPRRKTRLN